MLQEIDSSFGKTLKYDEAVLVRNQALLNLAQFMRLDQKRWTEVYGEQFEKLLAEEPDLIERLYRDDLTALQTTARSLRDWLAKQNPAVEK